MKLYISALVLLAAISATIALAQGVAKLTTKEEITAAYMPESGGNG